MPWLTNPRFRDAVIFGSFCRSDPAAAFRGLANGAFPARTSDSLRAAKSATAKNTSPRTSSVSGASEPDSRCGMTLIVFTFAVTSSPTRPSPLVAARISLLLIHQIDRQAVYLELTEVAGLLESLLAELSNRALGPTVQFVSTERVVQAQQSLRVLHSRERGRRRRADLLRRRVRRTERGKGILEIAELPQDQIELAIRHGRRIEHVVTPARVVHPLAEICVPLTCLRQGFRSSISPSPADAKKVSSATSAQ